MLKWFRSTRPWGIQQFGFSSGVSTDNDFLCLEVLGGYCTRELKISLFANFVDLQRAFPSMLRTKALQILHDEIGLPYELLRAFASTFSGNTCSLRINDQLTREFFVNRGTKEGGINSPNIFNTVYAFLLRKLGFFFFFFFFVDRVLAVPPPFFARCPIFRNQLSHVENRTEPASQIPEEG